MMMACMDYSRIFQNILESDQANPLLKILQCLHMFLGWSPNVLTCLIKTLHYLLTFVLNTSGPWHRIAIVSPRWVCRACHRIKLTVAYQLMHNSLHQQVMLALFQNMPNIYLPLVSASTLAPIQSDFHTADKGILLKHKSVNFFFK